MLWRILAFLHNRVLAGLEYSLRIYIYRIYNIIIRILANNQEKLLDVSISVSG
jgi:hypothetical protein